MSSLALKLNKINAKSCIYSFYYQLIELSNNMTKINDIVYFNRFHYCAKVWDSIKKSQFFNEYNRLQA